MSTRRNWKVLACLFWVLFLGIADNQVLSPLLPAIQREFHRTPHELALLFTGYSLCAGISVLAWGPLSDRSGRRRGLVTGLLLFGAGAACASLAFDFRTLMSARALSGMGASMLSLNVIAFAGDYFPYERRGRAMGFIFSSYFAALILGVPIGGLIGHAFGWRAVFGLVAAAGLVSAAAVRWLLPALRPARRPRVLGELLAGQIRTYSGFLRRGETIGALAGSALASGGTVGFLAFLSVWMSENFSVGSREISLVFMVSGIGALIASPFAGALSDRIGKRRQFWIASAAMSAFLVVLPRSAWGVSLLAAAAAIGLSAAFRQGPLEAIATEVVPADVRGSFVALRNACSQLGIAVSAAISGALFEQAGYSSVCFWSAGCNLLAALGILSLVQERRPGRGSSSSPQCP